MQITVASRFTLPPDSARALAAQHRVALPPGDAWVLVELVLGEPEGDEGDLPVEEGAALRLLAAGREDWGHAVMKGPLVDSEAPPTAGWSTEPDHWWLLLPPELVPPEDAWSTRSAVWSDGLLSGRWPQPGLPQPRTAWRATVPDWDWESVAWSPTGDRLALADFQGGVALVEDDGFVTILRKRGEERGAPRVRFASPTHVHLTTGEWGLEIDLGTGREREIGPHGASSPLPGGTALAEFRHDGTGHVAAFRGDELVWTEPVGEDDWQPWVSDPLLLAVSPGGRIAWPTPGGVAWRTLDGPRVDHRSQALGDLHWSADEQWIVAVCKAGGGVLAIHADTGRHALVAGLRSPYAETPFLLAVCPATGALALVGANTLRVLPGPAA